MWVQVETLSLSICTTLVNLFNLTKLYLVLSSVKWDFIQTL